MEGLLELISDKTKVGRPRTTKENRDMAKAMDWLMKHRADPESFEEKYKKKLRTFRLLIDKSHIVYVLRNKHREAKGREGEANVKTATELLKDFGISHRTAQRICNLYPVSLVYPQLLNLAGGKVLYDTIERIFLENLLSDEEAALFRRTPSDYSEKRVLPGELDKEMLAELLKPDAPKVKSLWRPQQEEEGETSWQF